MLIAKPQRQPGTICALRALQVLECQTPNPAPFFGNSNRTGITERIPPTPLEQRSERVGGQIGATAVEWQPAPATAKCGKTTVPVLDADKPTEASGSVIV